MEFVILLMISQSTTCAPNGIEDVNLNVFNMIIGINESDTTTRKIE